MLFYTALNLEGYAKHIISAAGNKRAAGYYSGLASTYPLDLVNKIHSPDNLNNKGKDIFYFTSSNPSVALEIRDTAFCWKTTSLIFISIIRLDLTLSYTMVLMPARFI